MDLQLLGICLITYLAGVGLSALVRAYLNGER